MNGYKLLGYVVWRARKWFLRRLLPSRRAAAGAGSAALAGAAALAGLAAAVLVVRRLTG
jgi:hypothetical protein